MGFLIQKLQNVRTPLAKLLGKFCSSKRGYYKSNRSNKATFVAKKKKREREKGKRQKEMSSSDNGVCNKQQGN